MPVTRPTPVLMSLGSTLDALPIQGLREDGISVKGGGQRMWERGSWKVRGWDKRGQGVRRWEECGRDREEREL